MRAFYGLLGGHSPGGTVVEREGLLAAVVPSCPGHSIVNGVVYEDPDALRAAHAELRATYASAGIQRWRVWVPEGDRGLAEWLAASGHRLSGAPRAMTLELGGLEPARERLPELRRTEDARVVASLNEQAYGLADGEFAQALDAFAGGRAHLYVADEQGEPAACAVALDADGDCGIYAVATRPGSRGRGLATGLMRAALADARDRCCTTSSLQSSTSGYPVYSSLGYRDLCAIETWEHVSPDPAP